MAAARSRGGKCATADQLRVELIPYRDSDQDGRKRKESVQKIIGLMFMNLHKRGRPKKNDGGLPDAA
jgi:hypothetical protein